MKEAIRMFYGCNKMPPYHLVLFRDGLSEGEYAKAADKEIQAIRGELADFFLIPCLMCLKDAIDALWAETGAKEEKPLLTYIVVGKK